MATHRNTYHIIDELNDKVYIMDEFVRCTINMPRVCELKYQYNSSAVSYMLRILYEKQNNILF